MEKFICSSKMKKGDINVAKNHWAEPLPPGGRANLHVVVKNRYQFYIGLFANKLQIQSHNYIVSN